ncbi:MAG: isoamylase, partial [Actinomycetota bacterium]|nr:isoamylase [Actinomycetota bacterium]
MPSTRKTARKLVVTAGHPQPLGATICGGGVNFSVFSEHASAVQLLLFAGENDLEPEHVFDLDEEANHSFHFWHIHVRGVNAGQLYAFRMDGPSDVSTSGRRFNFNKVVVDPYALGNVKTLWNRVAACGP